MSRFYLELVALPAQWHHAALAGPDKDKEAFTFITNGTSAGTVPAEPEKERVSWGAIIVYALMVLYCIGMVGVSGGPNHGEHPAIITFILLIACIALGYSLTWGRLFLLVALGITAVVFGFWAVSLISDQPLWKHIVVRAGLLIVFVIMPFAMLGAENRSAVRAGENCLDVYVQKSLRGSIQALENGTPVAEGTLDPALDCRVLLFLPEDSRPDTLRITAPDGTTHDLPVD
jgi:hypothetical protein